MICRRAFLGLLSAAVPMSLLCADEAKKKKDKPRPGVAGDRDGKDDVRGAVWEITAVNEATKDREVFRIRHQAGVVFDIKTGEKIGAVSEVGSNREGGVKSRIVLKKSTPVTGEMVMTQSKLGVWGGTLKTEKEVEWKCIVKVMDR